MHGHRPDRGTESARVAPTFAVRARSPRATRGILCVGGRAVPCALGRSGRRAVKREGDGATPFGRLTICEVLYRADRVRRPQTGVAARPLRRTDGWCDAPGDRNYNRLVRHPYPASAEALWRDDHLYDIVVILGYNRRPRIKGNGSAIFLHLARDDYAPTAGCIALSARDMRIVLARLTPGASLRVAP